MDLTYRQEGDFLIPNLTLPEKKYPTLGKYGMLRKTYLRQNRKALFNRMAMNDTLWDHLSEIDRSATEMMEKLTREMAQAQGVTEQMKATDQMLWVARMNNIRNAAEEIVLKELIYS